MSADVKRTRNRVVKTPQPIWPMSKVYIVVVCRTRTFGQSHIKSFNTEVYNSSGYNFDR